jgi:hypothetical protein
VAQYGEQQTHYFVVGTNSFLSEILKDVFLEK